LATLLDGPVPILVLNVVHERPLKRKSQSALTRLSGNCKKFGKKVSFLLQTMPSGTAFALKTK
jgi:dTDP-glucose pyrophosphorylase